MAGNVASLTATPARTPAERQSIADAGSSDGGARTGNVSASAGKDLPVPAARPDVVDVEKTAQRLNELMMSAQRSLRFRVDESSGRTVITVVNETTNEVIRQIPAEELLAIARNFERIGSMIDASA